MNDLWYDKRTLELFTNMSSMAILSNIKLAIADLQVLPTKR